MSFRGLTFPAWQSEPQILHPVHYLDSNDTSCHISHDDWSWCFLLACLASSHASRPWWCLLPVDQTPQSILWHRLDGICVKCNRLQLSLLVHRGGDRVDRCAEDRRCLRGDMSFNSIYLLGLGQQSLFLLSHCLCSVFVDQLKQLSNC